MRTISPARLRTAASEDSVLELARDYVGEWLPEDLAGLPPDCRPGRIHDTEDLNEIAFRLTQEKFAANSSGDNELVLEMQSFLSQACARIAEIKAVRSLAAARSVTRV
jgi:hypothetical protein